MALLFRSVQTPVPPRICLNVKGIPGLQGSGRLWRGWLSRVAGLRGVRGRVWVTARTPSPRADLEHGEFLDSRSAHRLQSLGRCLLTQASASMDFWVLGVREQPAPGLEHVIQIEVREEVSSGELPVRARPIPALTHPAELQKLLGRGHPGLSGRRQTKAA